MHIQAGPKSQYASIPTTKDNYSWCPPDLQTDIGYTTSFKTEYLFSSLLSEIHHIEPQYPNQSFHISFFSNFIYYQIQNKPNSLWATASSTSKDDYRSELEGPWKLLLLNTRVLLKTAETIPPQKKLVFPNLAWLNKWYNIYWILYINK